MANTKDRRYLAPNVIKMICTLRSSNSNSARSSAYHVGVCVNTVNKMCARMAFLGLTAAEVNAMEDNELIAKFYPDTSPCRNKVPNSVDKNNKLVPDIELYAKLMIERKLRRHEVYSMYREKTFNQSYEPISIGYFYKLLSDKLSELLKKDDSYLIQEFKYGSEFQIDFSGDTYELNTYNGRIKAWLMVIAWPASYYAYACFVTAQSTAESCRGIAQAISFFGNRAPLIATVDNAKCFVTKHAGSTVIFNDVFCSFMTSLGICINANPPRHPQGKSAVEYSVRLIQDLCSKYEIRADFNCRKTIIEHSQYLQQMVDKHINQGPFRKSIEKTRAYLFSNYELPNTQAVTKIPEYYQEVISVTVPRSYHLNVQNHLYSVPHIYIGKEVDVYLSNDYVVVKFEGKEIARHMRTDNTEGKTTVTEHMSKAHQEIIADSKSDSSPEAILNKAKQLDSVGLYQFCVRRIALAGENRCLIPNAIKCCKGVINFFEKNSHRELVSKSCLSVLKYPEKMWNTEIVRREFIQEVNKASVITDNRELRANSEMPIQNITLCRPDADEFHSRDKYSTDEDKLD